MKFLQSEANPSHILVANPELSKLGIIDSQFCDVLVCTEVLGDGNAIEVLTNLTVMDWSDIKQEQKSHKQENDRS